MIIDYSYWWSRNPIILITNTTIKYRKGKCLCINIWMRKKYNQKALMSMALISTRMSTISYDYEDLSNHKLTLLCLWFRIQTSSIRVIFLASSTLLMKASFIGLEPMGWLDKMIEWDPYRWGEWIPPLPGILKLIPRRIPYRSF